MASGNLKYLKQSHLGFSFFFLKILLGVLVLFSFKNLVNICWKMCVAGAFGRVKSGVVARISRIFCLFEKNETHLQLKRWST